MTISNGIDPATAQRWMTEGLRVYDDLEALKIENMNKARIIRARLPEIYEAAKLAGLPVRALKQSIRKVLLEQKIEGLQEDIEGLKPEDEDDAAAYEMMQAALGDFAATPLGAATLDQAADRRDKAAAKKQAKQQAQVKAAAESLAAGVQATGAANDDALVRQNTERLEGGITPIPASEPFEDDAAAKKPSRRQQRAAKLDDLAKP